VRVSWQLSSSCCYSTAMHTCDRPQSDTCSEAKLSIIYKGEADPGLLCKNLMRQDPVPLQLAFKITGWQAVVW
jgi:hypothetical protein